MFLVFRVNLHLVLSFACVSSESYVQAHLSLSRLPMR